MRAIIFIIFLILVFPFQYRAQSSADKQKEIEKFQNIIRNGGIDKDTSLASAYLYLANILSDLKTDTIIPFCLKAIEEADKKIKYSNDEITVVWKPGFCKHSGRCVTQLPQVFDLKAHPWINARGADTPTIIAQVNKCPTGALSFFYNDQEKNPD